MAQKKKKPAVKKPLSKAPVKKAKVKPEASLLSGFVVVKVAPEVGPHYDSKSPILAAEGFCGGDARLSFYRVYPTPEDARKSAEEILTGEAAEVLYEVVPVKTLFSVHHSLDGKDKLQKEAIRSHEAISLKGLIRQVEGDYKSALKDIEADENSDYRERERVRKDWEKQEKEFSKNLDRLEREYDKVEAKLCQFLDRAAKWRK